MITYNFCKMCVCKELAKRVVEINDWTKNSYWSVLSLERRFQLLQMENTARRFIANCNTVVIFSVSACFCLMEILLLFNYFLINLYLHHLLSWIRGEVPIFSSLS